MMPDIESGWLSEDAPSYDAKEYQVRAVRSAVEESRK
jgi:hypothetical protein